MSNQASNAALRPLAPVPRGSRSVQEPTQRPVIAACEACRRRKVKCDAIRPQCSPCISSGRGCQYATQPAETRSSALRRCKADAEKQLREIHRSHDILVKLIRALISYEEEEAKAILQQLRQGADPTAIVQGISNVEQTVDGVGKSVAAHGQYSPHKQISGELPPIAEWYTEDGDDGEGYEELFRHIGAVTREEAIEVIGRIQEGHDVSDILRLVKDSNPGLQ